MPTPRSVRNAHTGIIATIALTLVLALPAHAEKQYEITLDEAREVAVEALAEGDPGLAIQIARGLLQADPHDATAHFIIANAYAQSGRLKNGRKAAAQAYRDADQSIDKFRAADLAAKLAFAEKRYSVTQLWLRRAAVHAPTRQAEEQIGKDYRVLRQVNPLSLRFRSDLRPSSNVNNGSDTALNIIDGVPDGGSLSGSARALSGLKFSVDLGAAYRLRRNENSATSIAGRLYVERVALSSDAKAQAPNVTGSDFANTYGELALSHVFATGGPDGGGAAKLEFALGESWYAGERYYRFGRASADNSWSLGENARLKLGAWGERRYDTRFLSSDARILGFGAEYALGLNNGDIFSLTLALRDSQAKFINGTYSSASMRGEYTFREQIGPARVSLGMVLGYSHYDSFAASILIPPSQRTDKSAYGDISFAFDEYDYAGFVPTLRLRTGRRSSNFSRFDTREFTLTLGFGSKF